MTTFLGLETCKSNVISAFSKKKPSVVNCESKDMMYIPSIHTRFSFVHVLDTPLVSKKWIMNWLKYNNLVKIYCNDFYKLHN